MASVNKVILLGTLGRDPEVRFSANQLPIASLSLATSSFRRSAESQDRIEETEWHRVTLFGRQAEIAQQYLRKGSLTSRGGSALENMKKTDKRITSLKSLQNSCS